MSARAAILRRIRERGPITAAEYLELALYHPEYGYYATRPQRSGTRGDFFTSVDVGSLFGETIVVQLAEMWELLRSRGALRFDFVEVGAGNGRLACDILDAAAREYPDLYSRLDVTLVERSDAARQAQRETLAEHDERLRQTSTELPQSITGLILANELLDALPVHAVTITERGPREIYVGEDNGTLVEMEGPLSKAALEDFFARADAPRKSGWHGEVNLAAEQWIATAAAALESGFLLLFDYGYVSEDLHSAARATGTLTAYRTHTAGALHWLSDPGACDLTSHVNFTSLQCAAEAAGLVTLGLIDQTYFLAALCMPDRLPTGDDVAAVSRRLAGKTLLLPGGLGSTMKVMAFGKNVGRPMLRGLSSGRLT